MPSDSDTLRGKEDVAFSEIVKGPKFGLEAELAIAVSHMRWHNVQRKVVSS